ncbi:MAG: hypothetical protein AB7O98_16370 [Hyphomonadaceae bacterium]
MNRLGAFPALLLLAACGSQAAPDDVSSVATSQADEATWRAEVEAWANEQIDAQHEGLTPEFTNIFFGDFSGDGAPDAFLHAVVMGPTYTNILTAVFRNEGGHMVLARKVDDVFGAMPENVQFSDGQVTLTTTFMEGPEAGQSENWIVRVP